MQQNRELPLVVRSQVKCPLKKGFMLSTKWEYSKIFLNKSVLLFWGFFLVFFFCY